MNDYIKREDAISMLDSIFPSNYSIDACRNMMYRVPAADVVEQKHGWWMPSTVVIPVRNTDGTYSNFGTLVCSSCNNPVALIVWDNFCPNCGAKMQSNTSNDSNALDALKKDGDK